MRNTIQEHLDRWVHLAQIDVIAWDPEWNTEKMIKVINETPAWELIIFPEMCVPGYMIGDDWLKDSLVKDFISYNDDILTALEKNANSAIWWNVEIDKSKKNNDGTVRKYNTAYIAENGKVLWKQQKTLLPNYRMFDDKRYFTSLAELACEEERELESYYKPIEMQIRWVKTQISALICEDIWNIDGDYSIDPIEMVRAYKPDLLAVVSTSPFWRDKAKFRDKLLTDRSSWTNLAYVNPIWVQNIGKNFHAMDGGSSLYSDGEFIKWIEDFTTKTVIDALNHSDEIEQAYKTITYTLRNFWESLGRPKVIIGLSWGIDSGVVAALLEESIGAENIVAVNMPSKFNTNLTKDLAAKLAEKINIPKEQYHIFPIQDAVDLKIKQIEDMSWKKPSDFEIENIQARERWQILSDLSAHYSGIHTCNGNKDETALWYATLYGDVSWAIAPIWDLHKYQVFELARFINKKRGEEIIPIKMIEMKPSAELSEEQNPEEGWGDPFNYEFLGKTLKALWERQLSPEDLLAWYRDSIFEKETWMNQKIDEIFSSPEEFIGELEKIWELLHRSYFKRVQWPPIITVNKASFWFDLRESQKQAQFTKKFSELKKQILSS